MMKKAFVTFLFIICFSFSTVLANKTGVVIHTPSEVKKGEEVTIVITVSHNGNSKAHHTEWVYLNINGKEVKRWTYSKTSLPPDGEFTLEFKVIAGEAMDIEVQGNCNLHGSAGLKKAEVKVA